MQNWINITCLNTPFYKAWNEGKLTREIIKDYAEQYYQHVKAFPRYISATHSLCEDLDKRKILLENLQDEEKDGADHPKLWKNFAALQWDLIVQKLKM